MNLPKVSRESGAAWHGSSISIPPGVFTLLTALDGIWDTAGGAVENREKKRDLLLWKFKSVLGKGEFPLGCHSPWRVAGRVDCGTLGIPGMREGGTGFLRG